MAAKLQLISPEEFLEAYPTELTFTRTLYELPYPFPKDEWGEHLPFSVTLRYARENFDTIVWAKQYVHVTLPGVIGCVGYCCWQVEGKTYRQWLKYFDYVDEGRNFKLYETMREEAANVKKVFGYKAHEDLILVAKHLRSKGIYE